MGRYSSIEWAGKTVRESTNFILTVTDQIWNYSQMNEWRSAAAIIENLGIKPLVKAYNAVAKEHELPEYAAGTEVKGLIGGRVKDGDQSFVRKEAALIAATFDNAMQYMANNEGWQEAQEGMEKAMLQRLENIIRLIRCVSFSDMEVEAVGSKAKVAA